MPHWPPFGRQRPKGDQCGNDGTCIPGNNVCECTTNDDCEELDDNNPCNGTLICSTGNDDGTCEVDPATVISCDSSNDTVCSQNQCVPEAGGCQVVAVSNGISCSDGNACTTSDVCSDGQCQGGADLNCDDGEDCTADSCDPTAGCQHTNLSTECDDGDACTTGDLCVNGACVSKESVCECTSDDDCVALDDGNACNGSYLCNDGSCKIDAKSVVVCDSSSDTGCAGNTCDPKSGACIIVAQVNGTACNDLNACTQSDSCVSGKCVSGGSINCNDNNVCTIDTCNPESGCTYKNKPTDSPCSDGDACSEMDYCDLGVCVGSELEDDCECENDSDCFWLNDDNVCNGALQCSKGLCIIDPSTVISCPAPGGPCKESGCNPNTGQCSENNAPIGTVCDDANACTWKDACQKDGACKGQDQACTDNNPCTVDDCDPKNGCVFSAAGNEQACDDANPCSKADKCQSGTCVSGTPICECSIDADCNAFTVSDLCAATLKCQAGICVTDATTAKVCTEAAPDSCHAAASCNPKSGECVFEALPDGTACHNGDQCTFGDSCSAGVCQAGPSVDCDDGNLCTSNSCEPTKGCANTPNTEECNDGKACTANDQCKGGVCQGELDDDLPGCD
ncbi:MAG TPA: hypothetical protein EYN66_12480 [Myxococcales bacterium]|nr:hypothetical protein [Myxococcales bacterium]